MGLNGLVYFRAHDGSHGYELWRTDGTEAGTELVIDLNPGPLNGFPDGIAAVNGALYFNGFDTSDFTGSKAWRSDGTEEGTRLLKDINPAGDSVPLGMTEYKHRVYFSADDGVHGIELWVTDGTEEGTQLFADINPGALRSSPQSFKVAGGLLSLSRSCRMTRITPCKPSSGRPMGRPKARKWSIKSQGITSVTRSTT